MEPEPLPKDIYDRCIALGVFRIELRFSGGSDEGYLDVETAVKPEFAPRENDEVDSDTYRALDVCIEEWADSTYEYSGAGDGDRYGDNIVYDLEDRTVVTEAWYTQEVFNDPISFELEIADDTSSASD